MTPLPLSRKGSQGPTRRRSGKRPIVSADQLLALVAANNLDALIDAAFQVLQGAVASDFVSAFYRSSSKRLMKERDSLGREYGPAFMRRYMETSPAIPLAVANRGVKVLLTRTGLPQSEEEVQRTAFYRDVMQPQGWRHGVALCRRDFSAADTARLESIHPFIDSAVSRLLERDSAKSVWESLALTVGDGAFGLAVLDRNFGLVEANPVARRLCAAWVDDVSRRRTGTEPFAPGGCRQCWKRRARSCVENGSLGYRPIPMRPFCVAARGSRTLIFQA